MNTSGVAGGSEGVSQTAIALVTVSGVTVTIGLLVIAVKLCLSSRTSAKMASLECPEKIEGVWPHAFRYNRARQAIVLSNGAIVMTGNTGKDKITSYNLRKETDGRKNKLSALFQFPHIRTRNPIYCSQSEDDGVSNCANDIHNTDVSLDRPTALEPQRKTPEDALAWDNFGSEFLT